jgi:arylsulfatase A-like enzyme
LWVHYFDPHPPHGDSGELDSPPPLPKENRPLSVEEQAALARFLYDSDVRALDTALEALRTRLERDADRFETHVVVTSDHGESFGEDGAVGHGFRVTDEQIRVPLFIISPRVAPGVRSEPVGSIDVGATLIDLAGLGARWGRGVSLLEPSRDGARVVGMRRKFAPGAVEKLADGSRRSLSEHRFYRVEGDRVIRGSSASLDGAASSEEAERIRAEFAGFEQELAESNSRVLEDPETRAGLEALGYTQ